MTKKPCIHELLADNETGKVLICRDCCVVHLHLKNLSLRFDAEQFADFATMMTTASKRMAASGKTATRGKPVLTVVH